MNYNKQTQTTAQPGPTDGGIQEARDAVNRMNRGKALAAKLIIQFLRANPGSTSDEVLKATGFMVGVVRFVATCKRERGKMPLWYIDEEKLSAYFNNPGAYL